MAAVTARISWYRNLRWAGLPLLFTGVCLLLLAIAMVATGQAPWHRILLGMLATGTGLASFGVPNDTALALMKHHPSALDDAMKAELSQERTRRAEALASVGPQPRLAHVMPLLSLSASALLLWRLIG